MGMILTPRCKKCGERPLMIPTSDGLPPMVGFQLDNGKVINICKRCMIRLGQDTKDGTNKEEWEEFFSKYRN